MDRLADVVILSWGWRRLAFAFAAGTLSALAQAPFFAFPVLWLTFPVLVWLLDGAVSQSSRGRVRHFLPAFIAGWTFGFGYFLAGLWWIGAAFLVEADEFGWLMPFAVIALPAGLAVFWGLGAAAARFFWSEDWRRVFALAAGIGSAEWARGLAFTGFPWNGIGYSLTGGEVLMQSAALFGVDALGFIAVAVFAASAVLAGGSTAGRNVLLPSIGLGVVAALGLYGFVRLAAGETLFVPDVAIRIVQPALSQLQKWRPENKEEVLSAYVKLSSPAGQPLAPGTVLVWPESAFPFALTEEPGALAAIAELLPAGTALVTGAYRTEYLESGGTEVFNAIYVLGDDGTVLDVYDKMHLVPFGEYLPARGLLTAVGLRQLVQSGFTAGMSRRQLALPFGPSFAPLICYEAVFTGAVLPDGERPGYLLNVTNDGWFGRTVGPHQHFHQARVRAVEEGLPLVRAANTGISAIIDAHGRIVAGTSLGEVATIEARLPSGIAPPFYSKWRQLLPALALIACAVIGTVRIANPAYRI